MRTIFATIFATLYVTIACAMFAAGSCVLIMSAIAITSMV